MSDKGSKVLKSLINEAENLTVDEYSKLYYESKKREPIRFIEPLELSQYKKKVWFSIRKADKCLFSRRNGIEGKILFGYSIRLRFFGIDLI